MLSREIIIALCASTLFVGSGASPRPLEPTLSRGKLTLEVRQDEPAPPENPDEAESPEEAPPESLCPPNLDLKKLREDAAERKRIWDASGAGVLADEFINEHGFDNWVQDLDQKIFGEKGSVSDSWDCRSWGVSVKLRGSVTGLLAEYEEMEQGVAGYYLFYSLTQFHAFMKSYHDHITNNAVKEGINIIQIQDDFAEQPPESTNPATILSGVTSMLGVVGGPVGGALSVVSSAASLAGSLAENPDPPSDGGRPLGDRVLGQFDHLNNFINGANGGVFGIPGNNPDETIPAEMQRQTFGNPSVRALGDGQWLNPDPTAGMKEMMDEMYNRMKQGLAWAMLRDTRRAFVFADRPLDEGKCNDESGAWDPEEKVCLRLFKATGNTRKNGNVEPIDPETIEKITGTPYNLDLFEATKNAFNCWKDNGRRPAHPENSPNLEVGELPGCLFGMAVASGIREPEGIKMDGWAGQRAGVMWSAYDNRV